MVTMPSSPSDGDRPPRDAPPVSRLGRLARLGALAPRALPVAAEAMRKALGSRRTLEEEADAQKRLMQSAKKTAEAMLATLGEMKGLPLKLGQMASYIDGLAPPGYEEKFQRVLVRLQQKAPPLSPAAAVRVVTEDLGAHPRELYAEWEDEPFAAASIGQVHRATTRGGERVAVKVFAGWGAHGAGRDALTRFEREVRAMRALDHPNVVPLRDFLPEGPAIVLAWMGGGTLERLLATAGTLAPLRAVEIAAGVLTALGEAHRVGIVHRDVKPSNILFDDAGGARLSDFGVAHLEDASTTATAGVFGTLAYMSPEQREGRAAGPRSDLFSVGVVLREMLTGQRAGDGPRTAPSEAHSELDARHDALVGRLTSRDPASRPDDAFEARAALLALPWPGSIDPHAAGTRSDRRSSVVPTASRLEADASGDTFLDTWTGRRVECIPLNDTTLARARSFACAGHPALQSILRVNREDNTLWLDAASGRPLEGKLLPEQRAVLAAALGSLHAAGGVHGHLDAAHVITAGASLVLLFHASTDPTATPDRDWLALARL